MNIWVPRTKILENTKEAFTMPGSRVSGAYKLVGQLDDGRTRLISDWFPNIVTDIGLDRWGTGAPVVQGSVGSGTATPVAGDIALEAWIADAASKSAIAYSKNTASPYYGTCKVTFTFAPPGVNKSVAEVGVGWGSRGANLFSRARVKSAGGTDTIITWLASETLYLYYEARSYPFIADGSYSGVSISGTSYSGTVRLAKASDPALGAFWNKPHSMRTDFIPPGYYYDNDCFANAYNGAIGGITGNPGGTSAFRTSGTMDPYVAGSYRRAGTAVWGGDDANFTITAFGVGPTTHGYQMSISPAIVKAAGWTLALNLESGSWARYP